VVLETEVFLYGMMLLGVVGLALATRRYRSAATHLRTDHARALGLSRSVGADGPILRGTRDGIKVRVEHVQLGYGEHERYVTRVVAVGVAAGLGFSAENVRSGLLSAIGLGDVRVGDAAFDAHVRVQGAPDTLLAVLDVDTRRVLQHAICHEGAVVADGEVRFERPGFVTDAAVLDALLNEAAGLARRLGGKGGAATTAQLARSARREPDPTLRLRSLLALADTRSGPETVAVANEALSDVDARIQLVAALILGDAERLRLAPIAALRGLAPHAPERLARALQKAELSAALVSLLAVDNSEVRVASLHALAHVGTPEHLPAIAPFSGGVFGDAAVRAAADLALRSIRDRVGTASVGQVALVEGEVGAVSLAQEPGRVSLAEKHGS
jgi:hypothetical protein